MVLSDIQYRTDNFDGSVSTFPAVSLEYGAQNGYIPRLGGLENGKRFEEWMNNAPHVNTQVIAIPITPPAFFGMLGLDKASERSLKKIWSDVFSVHCKTINGLVGTISAETAEIQVGNSNSLFYEDEVKIVRERSNLVYGFDEKLGKPITTFLDFLLRYVGGHEHSQVPMLANNPTFRSMMKGRPYSTDIKAGTILYVQMDVINLHVQEAWLGGNIRNKKGGTIEAKKDITTGKEILSFDVEMMSFMEYGDYIKRYAQKVVDTLNIWAVNPDEDLIPWPTDDEANAATAGGNANPNGGYNVDYGQTGKIDTSEFTGV